MTDVRGCKEINIIHVYIAYLDCVMMNESEYIENYTRLRDCELCGVFVDSNKMLSCFVCRFCAEEWHHFLMKIVTM